MIVYMLRDNKTGRWWSRYSGSRSAGWKDEQKSGSVWTRKGDVALSLYSARRKSPESDPQIIHFSMSAFNPETDTVECHGVVWHYNIELDAWLCGTMQNGCGVFLDGGEWCGNHATPDSVMAYGPFTDRDTAIEELTERFLVDMD